MLGLVHEGGELAPLRPGLAAALSHRWANAVAEGGDDAPALPAGMGLRRKWTRQFAPRIRRGGLQALGSSAITSAAGRARVRLRRNPVQKVGLVAMPRTSRRPWSLTATATVTATDTMRPAWRTFR